MRPARRPRARIGGIEKQDITGNISYEADNHDHMVRIRAGKVRRVAQEIPPTAINGKESGDVLVVGWGGTYGAITAAVEEAQMEGKSVASVHIRHLNPLPPDLGQILRQYRRVLVPEINSGQLVRVLRAEYLVDAVGFTASAACRWRARRSSRHQSASGGEGVSTVTGTGAVPKYTKKDFESDQDVRWCPAAGTTPS